MKNDAISSELLESLNKASRKIRTAFNQGVTAHGLTYPRARTLLRLAKKQNVTQTELACELELEQATIVRLLDRMEENGLIERRADPNDRRVKLIALTEHGKEQAELVKSIGLQLRMHLFSDIDTQELQSAIDLLDKVSARLGDWSGDSVTK